MKRICFIFGTRPEAIKLAPIILSMKKSSYFNVTICTTGQHKELLYQVLNFFEIKPDINLNLMKENQSLFDITTDGLKALESVFNKMTFDGNQSIIIEGKAYSDQDILNFVSNLNKKSLIAQASLTAMKVQEDQKLNTACMSK